MASKKVLVVDDDAEVVDILTRYLKRDGYSVLVAADGAQTLRLVRETRLALAVLNPGLVGMDGLKTCVQSSIPIIVLNSGAAGPVPAFGPDSAVKDCVVKPVSPRNLAAKIRLVLRRASNAEQPVGPTAVKSDRLMLNFLQKEAYINGKAVHLTPTEFKLLGLLMREPNEILSRSQIIRGVVGEDFQGVDRNIDTHISNLRHKLERDLYHPKYIQTVYGGGYKFCGGTQVVG